MDVVKVGWSGGKDSTCSVLLHLEKGDHVKACCYIPMFTKEIPLICKSHYEFILRTADKFRSMGAEVYIVSGMTYWEYVTHVALSGKNKGKIFGFPCVQNGRCGFKRDGKERALKILNVGHYDYLDIGVAYDEIKRLGQLSDKKRSILFEQKYTEKWRLKNAGNVVCIALFILCLKETVAPCATMQQRESARYGLLTTQRPSLSLYNYKT